MPYTTPRMGRTDVVFFQMKARENAGVLSFFLDTLPFKKMLQYAIKREIFAGGWAIFVMVLVACLF